MPDPDSSHVSIPDKFYFKIGEVSEIADLPPYVLRFWESEFNRIRPKRSDSGQRLYRKKDIELILRIKHLLYVKKFTIKGAKKYLQSNTKENPPPSSPPIMEEIRSELKEIRALLK